MEAQQYVFSGDVHFENLINELMSKMRMTSRKEVISTALNALYWILDQNLNGNIVCSINENDENVKIRELVIQSLN